MSQPPTAEPGPPVAILDGFETARALARRLGLTLVSAVDAAAFPFVLASSDGALELRCTGRGVPGPVRVDLAALARRPVAGRGRREPLLRALGIDRGVRRVVDATAGLGRDAFRAAAAGCWVTMIERSPIVAALLADGIARGLAAGGKVAEATARLALVEGDAEPWLERCAKPDRPDAVYLDPMFAARGKTALAKKDIQAFRALLGEGAEDAELLALARTAATRRVVVKRHRSARPLGPAPHTSVAGTRVRYDIYLP